MIRITMMIVAMTTMMILMVKLMTMELNNDDYGDNDIQVMAL